MMINENFLIPVKSQSPWSSTARSHAAVLYDCSIQYQSCSNCVENLPSGDRQTALASCLRSSENQGPKVVVVTETSRYITSAATLAWLLNPTS